MFEWGTHDRHFGLHTSPPDRAVEVEARFGLHPVFGINAHREWHYTPDDFLHRKGRYRTLNEEGKLLDSMVTGAARKGDLLHSVLDEEAWDLFVGVFGATPPAISSGISTIRRTRYEDAPRTSAILCSRPIVPSTPKSADWPKPQAMIPICSST
jgi:hypothetical protein